MYTLLLFSALAAGGQSTPTIGEDFARRLGDALGGRSGATAISDCPDIGRSLRGSSGPVTCGCPAIDRDMLGTSVWGNQIYTDDSNICLAAIHDGRVTTSGGRISVWWTPGQSRYDSATRNGITSWDYQDFDGSIRFSPPATRSRYDGAADGRPTAAPVEEDVPETRRSGGAVVPTPPIESTRKAASVDTVASGTSRASAYKAVPVSGRLPTGAISDCPDTGRSLRSTRTVLVCGCPAIEQDMLGTSVWGNEIYTDDSNICLAAIHDGRIGLSGGKVNVWADKGRKFYRSATRNGITSIAYRDFEGSIRFTPPPARRR